MKRAVVVTNPMIAANKSAQVTLSKFLRIITPAYGEIIVVGGNISLEEDLQHIRVCSVPINRSLNKLRRIVDILSLQLKMRKFLDEYVEQGTAVYFWIGDKMILPYLRAKHLKGDVRYFVYGNLLKEGKVGIFKKLSARLIAYMANHADSLCVESLGVIDEWNGIVKNDRVRVIHLYTEMGSFSPPTSRTDTIGMICRLTPGKHVLECIEAFSRVRKRYPSYKLEIIGSGVQEDACRELIKSLHAEEYIKMYGWIEHNKIDELTESWKYMLFVSDTEGMPNSVLEAMGQGIPVISTMVGGICDLIENEKNGWIITDTSVKGIADRLFEVIEKDDAYENICMNARCRVLDKYVLVAAQQNALISCSDRGNK